MIEFMNISNALYEQMVALLDLMQSCDDSVDIKSIKSVSEMCATMLEDLNGAIKSIKSVSEMCATMLEDLNGAIKDIFDDWKNGMLKAPIEVN